MMIYLIHHDARAAVAVSVRSRERLGTDSRRMMPCGFGVEEPNHKVMVACRRGSIIARAQGEYVSQLR
jgi:hypothetical protein